MKKLTLAIFLFFLVQQLSGQFTIGLKATSPTASSQKTYKEFWNGDAGKLYGLTYLSTKTSYAYGLSLHSEFEPGWLTVDVLYRKRTVDYKLDQLDVRTRALESYEDNFTELSLPVLAGIRKNNFKVGLGPVFNYKIDSQYGMKEVEGFQVNPRKLNTGFQFMVGYVLMDHIHIDVKRELSFNQVGEDYLSNGRYLGLKTMPKTTTLSFGVFF